MSLGNKKTQKVSKEFLKKTLPVARGEAEIDLLIKNVKILDLVNGEMLDSAIAISQGMIVGTGKEYENQSALRIYDAEGAVAVPGFIDGHLHIESSMMSPFEFEKMTLPLGTTTAICDPHEITNVLGEKGFEWFLRSSELMEQNLFVQASSCVPALPGFETNGSEFPLSSLIKYREHPSVLGLAEMMNFPGVIHGNDEVLDKIEAFSELNLDGHSPLLQGKALNAYLLAGIQNCHETVTKEEGKEKLQKGMSLIIREGSVAKNLKTLIPLVNEFNSPQCFLCTDDRNPFEIKHEGHVNFMLHEMINKHQVPMHVAYRLSSFSAAKHFGLKRLGLIAPGKWADIVLLSDAKKVEIKDVLSKGKFVRDLKLGDHVATKLQASQPPMKNTIHRKPIELSELKYDLVKSDYRCIEIIPHEIITKNLKVHFDGKHFDHDDVLRMVNCERYGKNLPIAKGLVRGLGLQKGAIATSVAHDSHNLMAAGVTEIEMQLALNTLIKSGGGFCVVEGDNVLAHVELPIAGLMSLKSSEELYEGIKKLKQALKKIGCVLDEPFIQMAFLALPVIPELKLTDRGLFDVSTFQFIPLKS